ncbi:MAG: type IV pilus assembly protein PilM [bacterium]
MNEFNNDNKKKEEWLVATNKLLDIIRDGKKSNFSSPENVEIESIKEDTPPVSDIQSSKELFLTPQPLFSRVGFLKNRGKMIIGLDIGSHFIKFVQLRKNFRSYSLVDYGIKELRHNHHNDNRFQDIRDLLKHIDLSKVTIVTSLGGSSVIVRHIQFPPMTEEELAQSLKWEAKTYIPFPLDEVNLDYQVLGYTSKTKKLNVLLVAVTKKLLQSHLNLMNKCAITPKIVDINSLALINSYLTKDSLKQNLAVALIDIGAHSTILAVYRPGGLYFTKDIHISGQSFTKQIESHLNISSEEAEEFKRRGGDKNVNLYGIIKPVLDEFITELRRCLIYYDNQTGRKGFTKLIFTGGGSKLKDIDKHVSKELGIPVEHLNPFNHIYVDGKIFSHEILSQHVSSMGLCVGLAMRG